MALDGRRSRRRAARCGGNCRTQAARAEVAEERVDVDVSGIGQGDAALNAVVELAYVSRPMVTLHRCEGCLAEASDAATQFYGVARKQIAGEQGNILGALAQCRQVDRDHRQAVE